MPREPRLWTLLPRPRRRYASHAPLPPSHRLPSRAMNRSSPARDGDTLGGLPIYPRKNSQSCVPLAFILTGAGRGYTSRPDSPLLSS